MVLNTPLSHKLSICFYNTHVYKDPSDYRNSLPEVFCRKGALRNFSKFTGKHLCQSLYFNKVSGLGAETLLKKRLWHRCFPVNFVKFLRTPFFIEHLWWLLLFVSSISLEEQSEGTFTAKRWQLRNNNALRSLKPRKTSDYNSIALSIAKEDADVSFLHWKRRIAVVCRCSSKSCS